MRSEALSALKRGALDRVAQALQNGLRSAPFSVAVRDTIVEVVNRIIAIEQARGAIARAERSALDRKAQSYQDPIDRLFYAMAGLTDDEIQGLEDRLARML